MKGLIFDVEEFSLFDGPGIRICIFFKGCPLKCNWCHNPEGISFKPQIIKNPNGCKHCDNCAELFSNPDDSIVSGSWVTACPKELIRISGDWVEAHELSEQIRSNSDVLKYSNGGVTLTGGEVLAQPEFAIEILKELHGIHRAIETSGYAEQVVFSKVISYCELVIMDIKIIDKDLHKLHTGVNNKKILNNYRILRSMDIPHIIRIPLIPTVNDTKKNIRSLCALLENDENLVALELLPYNKMAHAKYPMVGLEFKPKFNPTAKPIIHEEIIKSFHIPYRILY